MKDVISMSSEVAGRLETTRVVEQHPEAVGALACGVPPGFRARHPDTALSHRREYGRNWNN